MRLHAIVLSVACLAMVSAGCITTQGRHCLETGADGMGKVDPPGRSWHDPGSRVGVAATPAEGWELDGWDVTGEGEAAGLNPLTVTMDSDRRVTAVFSEEARFSVSAAPDGRGSVAVSRASVPEGGSAEVEATPGDGWELAGWDIPDGCEWTGWNPITVTPTADCRVVAVFAFSWGGYPDLDGWLADNPAVAGSIVWESPDGPLPFPDWGWAEREELYAAFKLAWDGAPTGLADPPPPAVDFDDDHYIRESHLSADDARPLWMSYVANGLAVEISRRVPWSVTGYDAESLAILFDSRQMFSLDAGTGNYCVERVAHGGRAVPAPADYAWGFMSGRVGADRVETVGNLIEWCRGMVHYAGGIYAWNAQAHWQYRGFPPASRVAEGTPRLADEAHGGTADDRIMHRTAGCHGTTGFMRSVLRAVNIPVSQAFAGGHSLPRFPADGLFMSHGDDPYNAASRNETFPGEEILIDADTFREWFRDGKTSEEQRANVGRAAYEACVRNAGNWLLEKHRGDVAEGRGHAESEVYAAVKKYYTVEELEATGLWERLDARLSGG